jgi:hypothetical protein
MSVGTGSPLADPKSRRRWPRAARVVVAAVVLVAAVWAATIALGPKPSHTPEADYSIDYLGNWSLVASLAIHWHLEPATAKITGCVSPAGGASYLSYAACTSSQAPIADSSFLDSGDSGLRFTTNVTPHPGREAPYCLPSCAPTDVSFINPSGHPVKIILTWWFNSTWSQPGSIVATWSVMLTPT